MTPGASAPGASPANTPPPKNVYTVQKWTKLEDESEAWIDVATVELAPRVNRKSALGLAFAKNPDETPIEDEGRFRILDADSATVLTVKAKKPTVPDLEIT